ncbi:MAG: UDP-N-acetylmuramyl pentapeptide phosphotransferase, partial [Armatimonadota bacterium]
AFCANGLNLLDTRPSRAGSAYMLFSVILLVWSREPPAVAVSSALFLAVLAYLPAERRRECMMGDTGANMLGAVLGLHAALVLGIWQKVAALAALVWMHLYSENHSLSAAIENRPLLDRLDKALRGER